MFTLYKKVNKSLKYPNGACEIQENENPFKEKPCLLCVSAQNSLNKSIFGLTKVGTQMARIIVRDSEGAHISLDDVPINFLSIKLEKTNDKQQSEEELVSEFVKNI